MIVWEDAMHGIAALIADMCGLANDRVKWSRQGGAWPPAPWISLGLEEVVGVGEDSRRQQPNPLVLADAVVESVDDAFDTLTITAHAFITGDGPIRLETTGTAPAGVTTTEDLWVFVADEDTIRLSTSRANAIATVPLTVDLTDQGTGTHTLVTTADSLRVGEEILHVVQGQRKGTLRLKCFADIAFGAERAQGLLERIRARRYLPSFAQRLRQIGVSIQSVGPSTMTDGTLSASSASEPGASMDLFIGFVDGATEVGADIKTARIEMKVRAPDGTVVDSFVVQTPA